MIPAKVYTKRYRRSLARRDHLAYAELAHCFPCCDLPTDKRCRACKETFPCKLRRRITDTNQYLQDELTWV